MMPAYPVSIRIISGLPALLLCAAAANANGCHNTLVAPGVSLTARHCVTGRTVLDLAEVKDDWILVATPEVQGPPLPVRPLSLWDLMMAIGAGANLEIAGQQGCWPAKPSAPGVFASNCRARKGTSGTPVLLNGAIVGMVSGIGPRGRAVIVSAEQFAPAIQAARLNQVANR